MAISIWPASLNAALRSCQDTTLHLIKVAPGGIPFSGASRSRMKALAPLARRIWIVARPMPDAPPSIPNKNNYSLGKTAKYLSPALFFLQEVEYPLL